MSNGLGPEGRSERGFRAQSATMIGMTVEPSRNERMITVEYREGLCRLRRRLL
jgi:hypothetical protein